MKRLFLIGFVFLTTMSIFAGSDISIIALNSKLSAGHTCDEAIKSGVWEPYDK